MTTASHGIDIASQWTDELDLETLRFVVSPKIPKRVALDLGCGVGTQGVRFAVVGCKAVLYDIVDIGERVEQIKTCWAFEGWNSASSTCGWPRPRISPRRRGSLTRSASSTTFDSRKPLGCSPCWRPGWLPALACSSRLPACRASLRKATPTPATRSRSASRCSPRDAVQARGARARLPVRQRRARTPGTRARLHGHQNVGFAVRQRQGRVRTELTAAQRTRANAMPVPIPARLG